MKRLIRGEKMVEKKSWQEFKDSGLLWWINNLLHTFGYSIVFNYDDNGNISEVYPARVKFRGFDEDTNTTGYQKISKYMEENSQILKKESEE